MKSIFFLFCLFTAFSNALHAQDTIFFTNNTAVPARILEINETEIKYKKFVNLDGPDYVVRKTSVIKIVYQNGTADLLQEIKPEKDTVTIKKEPYHWLAGLNTVSFIPTDLFFKLITVTVEHSLLSNHLSIRIPFSWGLNSNGSQKNFRLSSHNMFLINYDNLEYYDPDKIFSTGLEISWFPAKQSELNYFVGPAFEYGQFNFYEEHVPFSPDQPTTYTKSPVGYTGILIKNGVQILPAKRLSIVLDIAMGFYQVQLSDAQNYTNQYDNLNRFHAAWKGGLSLGFRF